MITVVKRTQLHAELDRKFFVKANLVSTEIPETFPENGADILAIEGNKLDARVVFVPGSTLWVPSKDKVYLYDGAAWCDVSKRVTFTNSFM